jgi:hypothetical protein
MPISDDCVDTPMSYSRYIGISQRVVLIAQFPGKSMAVWLPSTSALVDTIFQPRRSSLLES